MAADRPFNPYAPGRHAALRETLAQAPAPSEMWREWQPWVAGRPLVAHNVGTERKMLQQIAPMHRLGPWVDTLALARYALPHLPDHALETVAAALGVVERAEALCPSRGWHDALFDAFACALILEALLALPGWEGVRLEALVVGGGG